VELLFRLDRVQCGDGQRYGEVLRIVRKIVFQKVGILKFVGYCSVNSLNTSRESTTLKKSRLKFGKRVTAVLSEKKRCVLRVCVFGR